MMTAVDDDRARLNGAVKSDDGFFTTFFISPWSRYVARWAARHGLRPNQVTVASLLLGLLASACFATGARVGLLTGAVVLQLAFAADCIDGQLARYSGLFSSFGGWLDGIFDRVKEYGVYAALALGSARGFGEDAWTLAAAAVALQTVRHSVDLGWAATRPPGERARLVGVPRTWRYWVRRLLAFPIGERFAVVCVAAALSTPRTTLGLVLGLGALAGAYGAAGKVVRSVRA
jgi:phosphatidylserine synthase